MFLQQSVPADANTIGEKEIGPVHESLKHVDPAMFPGLDLSETSSRRGLEGHPRYVPIPGSNDLGDTNGYFKRIAPTNPKSEVRDATFAVTPVTPIAMHYADLMRASQR